MKILISFFIIFKQNKSPVTGASNYEASVYKPSNEECLTTLYVTSCTCYGAKIQTMFVKTKFIMSKKISNYDELPYANKKIYDLVQYQTDGNVKLFAEFIGVSQQVLDRVFKKDSRSGKYPSISENIKNALKKKFNLNNVWFVDPENGNNEPVISYESGSPYYNVDFIGGFDLILNDQTINPEYYIQFKPYEKATCWCNITGHSMEPEISHGDIIALREIQDASFLPYGEIYAIVTANDMRTVKRIGPSSNPDNYTLIPTNKSPEYGIQELPKNMILRIFEVMGCMKKI